LKAKEEGLEEAASVRLERTVDDVAAMKDGAALLADFETTVIELRQEISKREVVGRDRTERRESDRPAHVVRA
jgi:hypothetical protein